MTTRRGGASRPPFDTMNLGMRCGDDRDSVLANRTRLVEILGCRPLWLHQVHGTAVVDAELHPTTHAEADRQAAAPTADACHDRPTAGAWREEPIADAAVSCFPGTAPAVLVADCLPLLLADRRGRVVAAAHAGWRGVAAGVVEAAVQRLRARLGTGGEGDDDIVAWLGPAIGPSAFEVGDEVRRIFVEGDPGSAACFTRGGPGKWYADLRGLVERRLATHGVTDVHADGRCTVNEPSLFFSYRRDGPTGRMAALVWLEDA